MRIIVLLVSLLALGAMGGRAQSSSSATNDLTQVLEAAGQVQFTLGGTANWRPATNGLTLKAGDRVRTGPASRAALQLSDRSIIRMNERTLLEIQSPRRVGKRRFGLPSGSIFFFDRERPADVEFETPLAAGAIRGTEFYLVASADGASMQLALLDGAVDLETPIETVSVASGEQVRITAGQRAVKTALIEAVKIIQWALYYPGVINPTDLPFTADELITLKSSLEAYRQGDLLAALGSTPEPAPGQEAQQLYRAALELSVGRVDLAEQRLQAVPTNSAGARALQEVIEAVTSVRQPEKAGSERVEKKLPASMTTSSELLARSYLLQSRFQLEAALTAARRAAEIAPGFGFAQSRVAELDFAFEDRRAALAALTRALELSPRLAQAHSLRGYVLLAQNEARLALKSFDRALELDAALGGAWLGRGLALMRLHRREEALRSMERAVALEPQRGLFHSYLGKTYSALHDDTLARKEFRLAKQLDPNDPTAWLYSALYSWQDNRINTAVRDLEESTDLNDNRSVYRSRLLLDHDRAVRSANLAAIYADAGLADVSLYRARLAVEEDYANFSSHLFLANSLQLLEDPNRYNLRLETARNSELLMANLLAPPGAGNLSQLFSQQGHLRFFDPQPVGISSFTGYGSAGDWLQAESVYGTVDGTSYAVDSRYQSQNGQRANEDFDRLEVSLQLKQQITASDSAYFQISGFNTEGGDLAQYYDPAQAKRGFKFTEEQNPNLYFGWHHEWSPGSRTLFLFSRLQDKLDYQDPEPGPLFLRRNGGFADLTTAFDFDLNYASRFTLYSGELQHIWETPDYSLVLGGRYQGGTVETDTALTRSLPGGEIYQSIDGSLDRGNVYAYGSWQIAAPLRLIAGVSYDRIDFPSNLDVAPITDGNTSRDLVAPKVGLQYAPWARGLFRASYTKSLGGLYFDNSVRLEPTQVAGFNQAFRSLIPESVGGLVPGTEFQTAGVAFDQSWKRGTYLGVSAEWLTSQGDRTVGVITNGFLQIPDSPSSTQQTLDFQERSLSVYVAQLLGDSFSIAARYRLSDARLEQRFPHIPNGTPGLANQEQNEQALLQQIGLTANFYHWSGVFAQWESIWFNQQNDGYTPSLAGDNFWQHNFFVGYRFPQRYVEVLAGVLNLTDTDYRLNPLNIHPALPRERTFVASLKFNF